MALPRFLAVIGLKVKELLPINSSAGAGDAEKLIATNALGQIDQSFFPAGIGTATFIRPASEALSAGDFVNMHDNAGASNARKADNTSYKPADGFVLAAVGMGANATIFPLGEIVSGLTGLTPGSEYFLGTAGGLTLTPPTAAGSIFQRVGVALTANTLSTDRGLVVERT